MNQSFLEYWEFFSAAFLAIFVILDPFAVVPNFLLFTSNETPAARRSTRIKATTLAFFILAVFALTGMKIFNIFSITLPAFQIAGGILLLLNGINQLMGTRTRVRDDEKKEGIEKEDVWIFPLGMPLIAGPGSISTVILLSSGTRNYVDLAILVLAIGVAVFLCSVVLRGAPVLQRVLGKTGLNLLTRIMGILLTAIAIQFMMNGVTTFAKQLAESFKTAI